MTEYELVKEFIDIDIENDLTKAVFGCLQLLSSEAINEIFSEDKFDFKFDSAPDFTFHKTVDRREPDVILEDDQHLTVMVEAKLGGTLSSKQLGEEYADLSQYWDSDNLRLLLVTEERFMEPRIEDQAGIPNEEFIWTNWRELAASLLDANTARLDFSDQQAMAMLQQIFENNGFAPFGGFMLMEETQSLTEQLGQAYRIRNQYYDDVNAFRKDVETHLTDEVKFWRFFRRGVSGGQWSGMKSFPLKEYERIPRNLWFSYMPAGKSADRATENYLENYLLLDFNSKNGILRAGYSVTTVPGKVEDDIFRKSLHRNKETILDILNETDYEVYSTSYSLSNKIDTVEGIADFLDKIESGSYDHSDWGRRFIL